MSREAHIVKWQREKPDPTSHPRSDVTSIAGENLGTALEEVHGHPSQMRICSNCQAVWDNMEAPGKYKFYTRYVRAKSPFTNIGP